MSHRNTMRSVIATSLIVLVSVVFLDRLQAEDPSANDFKPQPVIDIVRIQPFQLKQSFRFDWRLDRPKVQSGLLVVLKVDAKLVTPRNALEPVLYAGNQTVQRLNQGHESGFVIGIIPEQIDLSKEPIWFGTPALPERIDAKMIASERAKAERSGISALKSTDIRSRTQDPVVAPDLTALLREQAARLVLEFSPKEKRLVDSWRLTKERQADPPANDFKPQPAIDIVRIQPFRLKQSFRFDWRRERPKVQSGLLVVLKVDAKLVTPRNALEPVLYAGNQTVQRLNQGHESGFVIGIIPEQIDLSKEPIWFGTPNLPERIDAEMIADEKAQAKRSGVAPLKIDLKRRTQDPVVADDLTTLLREQAAKLVLEFSPQEKRLADPWRLPVTNQ